MTVSDMPRVHVEQISMDRSLQNRVFECWRLGGSYVKSRQRLPLPGSLYLGSGEATDYIHVRTAAYHNHLYEGHSCAYFVTNAGDAHSISEVAVDETSGQVAVHMVAGNVPRNELQPACCLSPMLHVGLEFPGGMHLP